jgi:hypothetical protein
MSVAQVILLVDGLVSLALRLLDTVSSSEADEAEQLAALKARLAATAERLAAWRP